MKFIKKVAKYVDMDVEGWCYPEDKPKSYPYPLFSDKYEMVWLDDSTVLVLVNVGTNHPRVTKEETKIFHRYNNARKLMER